MQNPPNSFADQIASMLSSHPLSSALLLRLYEAAGSGQSLEGVLEQVAGRFEARAVHVLALDASTCIPTWGISADLNHGALAPTATAYEQHHWKHDPRRRALALLQPGVTVRCQQLVDEREVSRSEFFQDYFLRMDLRWTLLGRLPQAANAHEFVDLALVRDPKRKGFAEADQRVLEQFLPHLRTALTLQTRLAQADGTARVLQKNGMGLLVLDGSLNVVGGTPGTAERLSQELGRLRFGAAGSLRLGPGATRRTPSAMALALRACLLDGLPRHFNVTVDEGTGRAQSAWLTATRRRSAQGAHEIALLIHWPTDRRAPDVPMLMAYFSLTRREAELGVALLNGQTPRQMWQTQKLSAATIRSQLRSLYAKTGVSGQVEFVRLAGGLGAADSN